MEACGEDAQNTFAIAVAGRGFDARISTEYDVTAARLGVRVLRQLHRRLPDRGADARVEYEHAPGGHLGRVRADGHHHDLPLLRRRLQPELHVQDNTIVKVTSPMDHDVTHGHLCVKGRFGFEFVQRRARE